MLKFSVFKLVAADAVAASPSAASAAAASMDPYPPACYDICVFLIFSLCSHQGDDVKCLRTSHDPVTFAFVPLPSLLAVVGHPQTTGLSSVRIAGQSPPISWFELFH